MSVSNSSKATPKVWLVRAGGHGEDEEKVLETGHLIIGFRAVGDLSAAKDYADVVERVKEAHPSKSARTIGNNAGQLWSFALGMSDSDIVALPRKKAAQVALGRVKGPYRFQPINGETRHTRPIEWVRPDVPRTAIGQDLLYSLGALMTVCRIKRNDAERRFAMVLSGKADPGIQPPTSAKEPPANLDAEEAVLDIAQAAHDQIVAHIQSRFAGHALAKLVAAVLRSDGFLTELSSPGPDGGVDILAGRGPLGLDEPRICVQVKATASPVDVTVLRALQGTMQTRGAQQGLLVSWSGFTKAVLLESKQSFFSVRLWDSGHLVEAIYRSYDRLPAEIQADLPLERVWTLVREEEQEAE